MANRLECNDAEGKMMCEKENDARTKWLPDFTAQA
jgi:hypothetical protein